MITRRFSGKAYSRSDDLGGFWTMISGSKGFCGSGSGAGMAFLRVFSFPLFLVGIVDGVVRLRRSANARPLGDGALFRFCSL